MPAVVQFQNAFIYQKQNLILSDVNVEVQKGEFVYLVGKTGGGKSSLLKTCYGDLPLQRGTGSVVGFDLTNLNAKSIPMLRRKLGIVFQDFQLLTDRSVAENLLFTMRATGWHSQRDMQHRIDEVLDKVGIKTKGFKMPHELSGGEQQRVVIARALLNNPELILADEPTGNLDPETSDDILALLVKINRDLQTAVIMATHDYLVLEKFPARILKCQNGQLTGDEHVMM
jgi:cell division transport system ATP-binding protein